MKKLLISVIALVAITVCVKAQIEMNASGSIGIGVTPNTTYKLTTTTFETLSTVRFDYGPYSGIKIENGPLYEKQIVPTSGYTGYLGTNSIPFRYVYAQYHITK